MEVFKNRKDPEYLRCLEELLALDGPNGLRNTASEIESSSEGEGGYSHCITIDFMGCSATTLLDRGGEVHPDCRFYQLEELAARTNLLNDEGTLVKLRFLFLYPYSAAAQIKIQAEDSSRRTSAEEPDYSADDWFRKQLTEETILGSRHTHLLRSNLEVLQDWLKELGETHPLNSHPNRVDLRFSAVNPMFCGLRINNHFAFDVYTYGKQKRYQRFCPSDVAPVILLNLADDGSFPIFLDHFRYLWELDTTIYSEGAAHESDGGLRFLPPNKIKYNAKARSVCTRVKGEVTDDDILRYDAQASRLLRKHCPALKPTPETEIAFIACSWRSEEDEPSTPIPDGLRLNKLLDEHFGSQNEIFGEQRISTRMIFATPGEDLGRVLYGELDQSTLGIVILSPEIDFGRKSIAKPNVYHELGYLMAHLEEKRTFLFHEESVAQLSNIPGLVKINYTEGKIGLKFLELAKGFHEVGVLTPDELRQVARRHVDALKNDLAEGRISQKEFKWVKTYVGQKIGPINGR